MESLLKLLFFFYLLNLNVAFEYKPNNNFDFSIKGLESIDNNRKESMDYLK